MTNESPCLLGRSGRPVIDGLINPSTMPPKSPWNSRGTRKSHNCIHQMKSTKGHHPLSSTDNHHNSCGCDSTPSKILQTLRCMTERKVNDHILKIQKETYSHCVWFFSGLCINRISHLDLPRQQNL